MIVQRLMKKMMHRKFFLMRMKLKTVEMMSFIMLKMMQRLNDHKERADTV